jgi:hypothetical protein
MWGMRSETRANLLTLAGALGGGLIGYCIFIWLASQGVYGLILPGGLLGLGAGAFKSKSILVALICGVAALALGFFAEWRFAPFAADDSLGYFVAHVFELRPITLIMISVGAVIGFWCPFIVC